MLCFSDQEPEGFGPRRISKKEIRETFARVFKIDYIKEASFASKHDMKAKAYITSMTNANAKSKQENKLVHH